MKKIHKISQTTSPHLLILEYESVIIAIIDKMLGSKSILTPMIHGLLRISCFRNPKNIRNPPYSGYFLMFYGSQSHAFSCKHEMHNLLTLVS